LGSNRNKMTEEELKRGLDKWFRDNFQNLQRQVSQNIAKDGMNGYSEELLSHCVIWFLERPREQKIQMLQDNKIENYILRCCSMQLKSSTSPFYREARKFRMGIRNAELPEMFDTSTYLEDNELYECMMREIKELHWYYQRLIEEKWNNKLTYQDLRKKYGITLASLKNDLNTAYNILHNKCNCNE